MPHLKNALLSTAISLASLHAAEITYTGVAGGEWATDSNWSGGTYPSSNDAAILDTTANLSVDAPVNIQSIHVGTNGDGRLQIGSQATLTATSNASKTSRIGSGSGNDGFVRQEGGDVSINRLEIGRDSATGTYHIHSGTLSVIRDTQSYSLFLGTNTGRSETGNGTFRISSGNFTTRAGVCLGSSAGGIGRFEVIGSHPGSIGIGSNGSLDGIWTQNAGSTLSVRIDKTSSGVTPIFIDDVGQDGGGNGDVIFENGALLDVGFTGAFLNGGTFTIMEWEGDVTDNGLQLAPSVDTNLWSFNVDSANKRLTVTAAGAPISRSFVHPGLSHKLADLERMRDMVAAGIEPYASSFAAMAATSRAQHTYQPSSAAADLETNGGTANNNSLRNDGVAAYYNALMWFITGDERHAEASIRIFTAWSGVKNIDGIPLNAGRHWRLIEAAEIIKSTYSGWDPDDLQAFKDMLVYPGYSSTTVPTGDDLSIYWRAYQGDPARHGNQGLFAMRCVMAIGVFLDNEIIYDRALRYLQGAPARDDDIPYITGPSIAETQIGTYEHFLEYSRTGQESTIPDYGYNEVIHNYIYPNGQAQEFSRDMAHGLAGIGIIATMSEIAWSQGDDLYGHLDNRPLLGLEYYYRYNVSFENPFPDQTTPWEPTVENGEFIQRLDQSGRWFSLKANPYLAQNVGEDYLLRGTFIDDPMYEMNLAHYRDRIGVSSDNTKWLERGLDLLIADQGFEGQGTPWDHPSWGGLTFRRVSPGDPVRGFSNGTPEYAIHSLPDTIEAENYDYFPLDGEGRTYHDLSNGNDGTSYRPAESVDLSSASEGDYAISSIEAGEWLTYTVSVPDTADYDISIRYASTAPGGTIRFSFDGTDVSGSIPVPHGSPASTGASDWQDLVIATGVPLSQGVQQLTITFGGTSGSFLLNHFSVAEPPALPVAHWRFEEGSGSLASDCTGNGHHGTINNATWTTRSGGGNALSFNGTNANVSLPASAFASLDNEVTLAFWAFGDPSLPSQNSPFWAGTTTGGRILNVHLPWTDTDVYFDAADRINQSSTEAETENAWVHWAFTKNANTGDMRIFRNGTLWHSATGKTNSIGTIARAFIGSENSRYYYPGLIDDFRLYDVALSSPAISTLYSNALNPHTLTYNSGLGGSISGIASQTIDHDSNACPVTAVPDEGYSFANWSDGLTDATRSDLNVTGDLAVTANFAINTYTLAYNAGANGTISGTTPQTVDHGTDGSTVTAVPDEGYSFANWSDGLTDATRSDLNVTGDLAVTAN
ncbi:MAG: InlB B-repeat-containing protein, partial [Verrucomicrobiota bacterium JB025]|nr:LamG-like jellyroll fold domain-containing protein [Verrucomicrobiota bacterium JB025]